MTEQTVEEVDAIVRRTLAFVGSVLVGGAGVIALVIVWYGFPDRADDPRFWSRTTLVTAVVVVTWSLGVWALWRYRPVEAPRPPAPEPASWWSPVQVAAFAGFAALLAKNGFSTSVLRDELWGIFFGSLATWQLVRELIKYRRAERVPPTPRRGWIALIWTAVVLVWWLLSEVPAGARLPAVVWLVTPVALTALLLLLPRR